jgi:hypothetical protein
MSGDLKKQQRDDLLEAVCRFLDYETNGILSTVYQMGQNVSAFASSDFGLMLTVLGTSLLNETYVALMDDDRSTLTSLMKGVLMKSSKEHTIECVMNLLQSCQSLVVQEFCPQQIDDSDEKKLQKSISEHLKEIFPHLTQKMDQYMAHDCKAFAKTKGKKGNPNFFHIQVPIEGGVIPIHTTSQAFSFLEEYGICDFSEEDISKNFGLLQVETIPVTMESKEKKLA